MINIIPIQIPTRGEMNQLSIQVNSFELFPSTINLYYTLSGESGAIDGNISVPEEVVTQWGTDDSIILNYALTALGLELDSTPE